MAKYRRREVIDAWKVTKENLDELAKMDGVRHCTSYLDGEYLEFIQNHCATVVLIGEYLIKDELDRYSVEPAYYFEDTYEEIKGK